MKLPLLFSDRLFFRSLFALAIPIMLQNLMTALVNMLGIIMVGRLGTVEIAAVGLGIQVFFVYNMFLFGICSGGAVFTAQFWGKGDIPGIRKNLGFCLTLNLAVAAVFTLGAALIPEKIISIYTRDQALIKAGADYLRIFSLTFIPFAVSMAFTITLRSVEKVRLAIVVTLITLSLNVVLNFLFIFGAGPFPAMGVEGAALAVSICRILEMIILVCATYLLKYVPAGSLRELFTFSSSYARHFLKVTVPVIVQEMVWALGISTQNVIFARTNTDAIAAFNITAQASQLTWVLFIGMANSVAVLIGKKIGEGNEKTAKDYASRIVRFAPILSIGAALILFSLTFLLPVVFNVNTLTLTAASQMFFLLGCSYPFRAFNLTMIVGVCRAGGDTVFTAVYDTVVMWLVSLPLAALAAFVFETPVWVIYSCLVIEEPLKAILGYWRLKTGKWLHNVIQAI